MSILDLIKLNRECQETEKYYELKDTAVNQKKSDSNHSERTEKSSANRIFTLICLIFIVYFGIGFYTETKKTVKEYEQNQKEETLFINQEILKYEKENLILKNEIEQLKKEHPDLIK